jgi:hypothetical protein
MSRSNSQGSQSPKASYPVKEPRSAQELCEQLKQLTQQPNWKSEIAERFVSLIVNPNRQYQLDTQQRDNLAETIINCPQEYRATVHLAIVAANFTTQKSLKTLDGIIPRISAFISECFDNEHRIKETLLKAQGEQVLPNLLKEKLAPKETEQKPVNKKGIAVKKIDWVRNLISLLICEGEPAARASRLNMILEAFANSKHYQQILKEPLDSDSDIKFRVKAVAELFKLAKPNATEAERLLLYGANAQRLATEQIHEIAHLEDSLQKERDLRSQREAYIQQLEQQCKDLKQQLADAGKNLEQKQSDLDHERKLYEQLEISSKAKISQQREAALSQVRNRLEHELQKLERCLSSSAESFQENSQIGMRIINKIREQLSTGEN